LAISPSELKQVHGCQTSRELWLKLESIYASKGPARKATLLKRLTLQRMQEGDDVREHMAKFFDTVDKLGDMDVNINDDLLSIMLLYSLPVSYENFRCAMETRDELPKAEVLKVKILEEDNARKQSNTLDAQGAMFAKRNDRKKKFAKQRVPNNKKTENRSNQGSSKIQCFKCHKFGHKAPECRNKIESVPESKSATDKVEVDDCFAIFDRVLDEHVKEVIQGNAYTSCIKDENVYPHRWALDSGCTSHLCGDKDKFGSSYEPVRGKLNLASHNSTKVEGKGVVKFLAANDRDKRLVEFQDVLHVPDLRTNFISVAKITDRGHVVTFREKSSELTADRRGDLCYVRENIGQASIVMNPNRNIDLLNWHKRMGHLNARDLMKLVKRESISGIKPNGDKVNELLSCDVCLRGKMSELPFTKATEICTEKLNIIHSDVVGPMRVKSFGGARFFVTFIDDSTRWCEIYTLKNKSEVLECFKTYKSLVEKQTGARIKQFQSDNGREYCNTAFDQFLEREGIHRRLSIPHTPQQNGVAERMNRTIMDMARCLMLQSQLPRGFWAEAIVAACYIRNRCPTSSLGGDIPYEKWTNKPVSLDHLRVFGSNVYILDKVQGKDKFAARSKKGIFVGYPREAKGYRVWLPCDKKVVVARDIKFLEKSTDEEKQTIDVKSIPIKSDTQELLVQNDEPPITEIGPNTIFEEYEPCHSEQEPCHSENEPCHLETSNEVRRAPGRPRKLKTGTPGRPKKIYNLRKNRDDSPAEGSTVESESEDNFFVEFSGLAEISLEEAMASDDHKEWEEAILSEISSMVKNDTWDIVERKDDQHIVGSRIVLTNKYNTNGTVNRKKARIVAKGYNQRHGVEYHHTFAPVARLESIRLLAALAAKLSLKIHQLDITTAYLNGELNERIFMEPPKMLKEMLSKLSHREGKQSTIGVRASKMVASLEAGKDVCLLKKSLYGLRQAGRQWNERLSIKLRSMGLIPTKGEPCMYHANHEDTILIIVIYVDDILIAFQDPKWIENTKKALAEDFEVKDFGLAKRCLGLEIVQNGNIISLSQGSYTRELLMRFGMNVCKPASTPSEVGANLMKTEEISTTKDIPNRENRPYRELMGALTYLAMGTRPDIANTVAKLAQFSTCHEEKHWSAAKRVLRYLRGTTNLGLLYRKNNDTLIGFADADWGGCVIDRRSFSGYVFMLSGAAISWKSQKQRTVSLSSTEAEYVSLSEATKEALYLRSLLHELNLRTTGNIELHSDNQGALFLASDPVHHARTKHIDIKCHFIRDAVRNKQIILKYLSTDKMIADVLTKALSVQKHIICTSGLGLYTI